MKSSSEIRQSFLDYFASKGHKVVASSPLIPGNDPTLLFTNAGMVQFKETFLGQEKRAYSTAATSQRCVRAGGKHNDLENVGYTARHHTFFEMLGNFSFGDYFKRDAIKYAWEYLTGVLGLPEDKLWVTVYRDDDEAADIWLKEMGIDASRFSRCGEKDNFWSMGDTGPCGPCSEIFYDHGEEIAGGPPGSPDEDGDRYIEIWNLVFMQYDRDASGKLNPLPHPSVDTGMGLERLVAVLQDVHNNYDIDLFQSLISAIIELVGEVERDNKSLRVIADHIRSCAFLVVDGVVPANEGRGYVLRRIIRRAIRHGHNLGLSEPFFYKLVTPLTALMGDAYPELAERQDIVQKVLLQEEERFSETLDQGMRILEQAIDEMDGREIPGEVVFRLYDTYGFPVDLTADMARERDLTVDMAGFETAMEDQRQRARAASRFDADWEGGLETDCDSEFTGYEHHEDNGKVVALYRDGEPVQQLAEGDKGAIILDKTSFYAESGGQIGDTGVLAVGEARFNVKDTRKEGDAIVHVGQLSSGSISTGADCSASIDSEKRNATARNHSATHLLHAALRRQLGTHVTQKGSLVADDYLRFDFSHFEPVSAGDLDTIERLVNQWILGNDDVETRISSVDEAIESGAMALFGEKYDEQVRVLRIGDMSTELCGGTHVRRAGDIGLFRIISETGIAAGVRRIEAVTGLAALDRVDEQRSRLKRVADIVKTDPDKVDQKIGQIMERSRNLEKELAQLTASMAASKGGELAGQAEEIDGLNVLAAALDNADVKTLRDTVDQLKDKLQPAAIILASVEDDKVRLVAGVSKSATDRIKAGPLVNFVAQQVGGKGGGRPDMAQAGGNDPAALGAALQGVSDWVREQL